jgi:hypothetical protein
MTDLAKTLRNRSNRRERKFLGIVRGLEEKGEESGTMYVLPDEIGEFQKIFTKRKYRLIEVPKELIPEVYVGKVGYHFEKVGGGQ